MIKYTANTHVYDNTFPYSPPNIPIYYSSVTKCMNFIALDSIMSNQIVAAFIFSAHSNF